MDHAYLDRLTAPSDSMMWRPGVDHGQKHELGDESDQVRAAAQYVAMRQFRKSSQQRALFERKNKRTRNWVGHPEAAAKIF
jgi:hypothetical protein